MSFLAFSGSIQLLLGPESSLFGVADEGQLLGPGDVVGVAAVEVGLRPFLVVERLEDGPVEPISSFIPISRSRQASPSEPSHQ